MTRQWRGWGPVVIDVGISLIGAMLLLVGCGDGDGDDVAFSEPELAKIRELSPAPGAIEDTTNKHADNPAAVALGHRLFFDPGYSGPVEVGDDGTNGGLGAVGETGKVSCRSCHLGDWMIDNRSQPANTSLAINWFFRNAPTLVNVATYDGQYGWVGFNDNLWGKSLIPAEFVMGTTTTRPTTTRSSTSRWTMRSPTKRGSLATRRRWQPTVRGRGWTRPTKRWSISRSPISARPSRPISAS